MKNLVFIFIFIFAGCSAKQDTEANFQVSMRNMVGNSAANSSLFPGGLILYGVSDKMSFSRIMDSNIKDELVPNGTWDFYVLGWDGNGGTKMTGKVYCAVAKNVSLNGTATKVELTATNAKCALPIFGQAYSETDADDNNEVRFPNIDIVSCNDLSIINNGSSATDCNYNSDPNSYNYTKGTARSYKIIATGFNQAGPSFNELSNSFYESSCVAVDPAGTTGGLSSGEVLGFGGSGDIDGLNIPPGSFGSKFRFKLRAYFGSENCIDTYAHKDIPLIKGAKTPKTFFNGTTKTNTMFVKTTTQDVCESRSDQTVDATGNNAPFKGGAGSDGMPFILCDGDDINEISNNYASDHFIVGRDIDMKYVDPSKIPCREGGGTMTPIGGLSVGECASESGSAATFTGTFNGNGKVIKNARVVFKELNDVGFVRTHNGAKLFYTKFEKLFIKGNRNVGLVGVANGTGDINEIKIDNAKMIGLDHDEVNLGGVVGYLAGNSRLERIHLDNVEVKNVKGGQHIGGAIGYNTTSSIVRDVFFNGRIILSPFEARHNEYVGGIVGKSAHASPVYEQLSSKGIIYGNAKTIGGIAGFLNSDLSSSYSEMGIMSTMSGPTLNIGGLVGHINKDGAQFLNSYFWGKMYADPDCGTNSRCNSLFGKFNGIAPVISTSLSHSESSGNIQSSPATTHSDFGALSGAWLVSPWENHLQPTLISEKSMCRGDALLSVDDQIDNRFGFTKEEPIIICTRAQFFDIDNRAGLYFKLGKSINLPNGGGGYSLKSHLDGNNHSIIINNVGSVVTHHPAIFNEINATGSISNLNVFGRTEKGQAILAGVNNGKINRVHVFGVNDSTEMHSSYGILAGENNGEVFNTSVYGKSKALNSFGSVAGINRGSITRTKAELGVMDNAPAAVFGGVVGHNTATGNLSESTGETYMDFVGPDRVSEVGGLVGLNEGSISDSYSKLGSTIYTPNITENVGGLVGDNQSTIRNSYSMNKVIVHQSSGHQADIGGLVGQTSIDVTSNYYLFNPLLKLDSETSISASCTGTSCFLSYSAPGFDGVTGGDILYHRSAAGRPDYMRVQSGSAGSNVMNIDLDYTISHFGDHLVAYNPSNLNVSGTLITQAFNDLPDSPELNNLLNSGDSWAEGSVYPFTPKLLHVDD
ncbi:MAG: hypothetical protein CME64_01290 [Halobacteriovoraceae bacterium]|nr:hypothetical protein [Halobacteriovoraceae bacterium]